MAKLSQKMYEAIGETGWPPWKVARFLKRANRIAMKMMREAEQFGKPDDKPQKLEDVLSKEHPLSTKSKAFKDAVSGMQIAIAAAEHMTKIALLVEAVTETERPTGGVTITISPTPEARARLDDDDSV